MSSILVVMTRIVDTTTRILYLACVSPSKIGAKVQSHHNQVRRRRRMMEFTQAELARHVEVSRQTVVSIEGGDYAPSVYLALRIAEVLETTVEELFATKQEQDQ